MCLKVYKKIRNNHHKENGYCVAYKVIRKDNFSIFYQKETFQYHIGENVPKVTIFFKSHLNRKYNVGDDVDDGLHLFLDKSMAKGLILWNEKHSYNCPENMKVIKVFYKPEDVIAYGVSNTYFYFSDNEVEKSVVVRKLTIKSLDPIE